MRLIFLLAFTLSLTAQDTRYPPQGNQLPAPNKPSDFTSWLEEITQWRRERIVRSGYDGSNYDRPEFAWAQRNFVQPQMMAEERTFYDPVSRRYTVDRYLDDLEKRYGGIDSVLIWPVYPNMGIDNRNQFDLARDLPGGPAGIRQMIQDFHRRNVHVFFPMMPWDVGTRPLDRPFWDEVAAWMAEIGADGVNGDTFQGIPQAFRAASDKSGHAVVFEPENPFDSDEMLMWNNQSWGYWKYPFTPLVSRMKWLETRHMVNVCDRWAKDKIDNLQAAFFNGAGYESWENVWGIWNQITPKDAEALRRISSVERQFAPLLVSAGWEPHTPTLQFGIFASRFPGPSETLWTLVNRNPYEVAGLQLHLPQRPGMRYFDVWNGVELKPEPDGDGIALRFALEAHGYGAVFMTAHAPSFEYLHKMAAYARSPLSSYSHEWKALPQRLVEIPATAERAERPRMVSIPAGEFEFQVNGIEIEGGNDIGVDVQYPWEPSPRRAHRHRMNLKSFWIDRYPVTNEEYKLFLDTSHYQPADGHNFLRDWKNGTYPDGWAKRPVTWVSLEDARAYAAWAGKRLPHEWEWQRAAQGRDNRVYPWGDEWSDAAAPKRDTGRTMRGPDPVDAHPAGASPEGVQDLVGNVWQWTEEFVDDHTRAAILRGGSYYQPQGSHWYFPQAYKNTEHGKYLLLSPGKDRSGAVGFRCAAD